MIILNFSHPLTPLQVDQLQFLTHQPVDQVVDLPVQFENNQPFAPQMQILLSCIPMSPTQLQTEAILIVLPALNFIAAMLLAELHGRMGYFPTVVRLRPVAGVIPPVYEVAELINLQQIRDIARALR